MTIRLIPLFEYLVIANIALGSSLGLSDAHAQNEEIPALSYDRVWTKVQASSASLKSAEQDWAASRKAADRAARHWWPRIFADARVFGTNDAGSILFSKLGTRSLTGMDLSPFAMNYPDQRVFERATLGAELPLFEGGAKVAEARFRSKAAESREYQKDLATVREYGETATLFGTLLIMQQQESELGPTRALVTSTISRYEVGASGNPVGYSGLLGLKNLALRIEGELEMIRARREGARAALAEKAQFPALWRAESATIPNFVAKFIERGRKEGGNSELATPGLLAQVRMAEGLRELKGAERARFLPKIALFAEGNLSSGNSASATAYSAGGYLQWELFSAPNFGALAQAELSAAAAEAGADALRVGQAAGLAQLRRASEALQEQLRLADRSSVLLDEQATAARKLFLNGSINALQLTEVFSRYVDLISAKSQMKEQYLKANVQLLELVPFEIPVKAEGGKS